jgi:flagellar hook-associated protein 2
MASISSTGLGSGLDVTSIITQLVALEKQPLKKLALEATTVDARISETAKIASQISALVDVSARLSSASAWTARNASSSDTSSATMSVTSAAAATSFSLDVDVLAKKQSVSSLALAPTAVVGKGVLKFSIGTWSATELATASGVAATAAATAAGAAATAASNVTSALAVHITNNSTGAQAYSDAYSLWVAAQVANTPPTAGATQTAQDDALVALNQAYDDWSTASPADVVAFDATGLLGIANTAATASATAATAAASAAALAATGKPVFTQASSSVVEVPVSATDTLNTVAIAINKLNTGVVASVFNDGTMDRLQLVSKSTGTASGFRVTANDTVADGGAELTGTTGLARLAYDPQTSAFGMGSVDLAANVKFGGDAKARINGVVVTSASNTLTGNYTGVSVEMKAVTTTSVTMSISEDVTPGVKNVDDFIKAYNDLNATLADLTKYDAATKTGALFQGDSTVVGLQNMLRSMVGSMTSGGTYQRLNEVGIERQRDGSLTNSNTTFKTGPSSNAEKFTKAAANNGGIDLMNLFTGAGGFAVKFAALGKGLMDSKDKALAIAKTRNDKEQAKVNDRATAVEARLRKTYTALDTKMASLTALNSYVAQQVTAWNKSTG